MVPVWTRLQPPREHLFLFAAERLEAKRRRPSHVSSLQTSSAESLSASRYGLTSTRPVETPSSSLRLSMAMPSDVDRSRKALAACTASRSEEHPSERQTPCPTVWRRLLTNK